jgi:hypothetical protein
MDLTIVYCVVYEVSRRAEGGAWAILPVPKDK